MATSRILGLMLIAIGTALLLALTTGAGGEVLVGLLGLAFLAAYATTRAYGFLVPGGILTGLGAGILTAARSGPDEAVVLGLGAGFLVIALMSALVGPRPAAWWWPLIPGGVLSAVAAAGLTDVDDLPAYLVPAALIVVGVTLLLRRGRSSPSHEETSEGA